MVLALMWTSRMAPGLRLEQGNQPIQFARGFPSVGTESLMPWGISKSRENWDSLPGIVLTLNLQGRCPGNYFNSEQTRKVRGGHIWLGSTWVPHVKRKDNKGPLLENCPWIK